MAAPNIAIYASRGVHSILKASFYPLPFYHPDKLVAGNLSHGLTHIAGTLPAIQSAKIRVTGTKKTINKIHL